MKTINECCFKSRLCLLFRRSMCTLVRCSMWMEQETQLLPHPPCEYREACFHIHLKTFLIIQLRLFIRFSVCVHIFSCPVDQAATLSPTRPSTPRPPPAPPPPTTRPRPALSQTSPALWPRSRFLWQQEEPIAGQLQQVERATSFKEITC